MSDPTPANQAYLRQRLAELEIDLCSALAISNALLAGLTATGPQQELALRQALDESLSAIATQDRSGSAEVHAFVAEVRERLTVASEPQLRMARNLERVIIKKCLGTPKSGEG